MRTAATTMMLISLLTASACPGSPWYETYSPPSDARFEGISAEPHTLFGRPPENGPITEDCCLPTCIYYEDGQKKTWTSPVYSKEDLQALLDDWVLAEPWPVFEGNDFNPPADDELEDPSVERVCAVRPRLEEWDGSPPAPYDLIDYESIADAKADGAMVTHRGRCGACSSLQNLAVYIARPNLTEPIRRCGFTGLIDRDLSRLACIASLGFDLPCAQAWDFNTRNTQDACLRVCGKASNRKAPGNIRYECNPNAFVPDDIDLVNDCLACDEEFSIALFRKAAGRSRRSSGLPSPVCRRCDGVFRVEHYYPLPKR